MLLSTAPAKKEQSAQGNVSKANCAGQGCPERDGCRRFQVRIVEPARGEWIYQVGQWISADIERLMDGKCPHFVRWHRQAA